MIIIFDLDGVLVDARDVHFECLNKALKSVAGPQFVISREDHLTRFDGLSTTKKLEILSSERGLPQDTWSTIWVRKQDFTKEAFEKFPQDYNLRKILEELKRLDIKLYCASNSIRYTISLALDSLGIKDLFDGYFGNDDVQHNKPAPDVYFLCMMDAGASVHETLIVEDSPTGRQGALNTGAHTLFVSSRGDLTLDKLFDRIAQMTQKPQERHKNKQLNIVIPMAGAGQRFVQAGYSFPKPLIEINGKPMIQAVVESINIDARYIYIVQRKHYEDYALKYLLNLITPSCEIIQIDGMTEGAACTTLLAKQFIDNDRPLLLVNSDQIIEWNPDIFFHAMSSENVDAGILTFFNTHPKWSYAKIDDNGWVTKVAEKEPISDHATVGVYYWKHGKDYVKYANQMIERNHRAKNEFYVCPVFNEALEDNRRIRIFPATKMWGLGTPEDLQRYLNQ